jgi:hypothetical protein
MPHLAARQTSKLRDGAKNFFKYVASNAESRKLMISSDQTHIPGRQVHCTRSRTGGIYKNFRETHDLLGTMNGCLQNLTLQQCSGPGKFNLDTVIEWAPAAAIQQAGAAVAAMHQAKNIKPDGVFERLGIAADRGIIT